MVFSKQTRFQDDSGSRLSLRRSGTLSLGHHAPAIPSAVKPFKVSLYIRISEFYVENKVFFFFFAANSIGRRCDAQTIRANEICGKNVYDQSGRNAARSCSTSLRRGMQNDLICFHFVCWTHVNWMTDWSAVVSSIELFAIVIARSRCKSTWPC